MTDKRTFVINEFALCYADYAKFNYRKLVYLKKRTTKSAGEMSTSASDLFLQNIRRHYCVASREIKIFKAEMTSFGDNLQTRIHSPGRELLSCRPSFVAWLNTSYVEDWLSC